MTRFATPMTSANPLPIRSGKPAPRTEHGGVTSTGRTTLGEDRAGFLSGADSLEAGTEQVLDALRAVGVNVDGLKAVELRGLGGLVGFGIVSRAELSRLAQAVVANPGRITQTLAEKRQAYMDRVAQRHGVKLADGPSKWTVQELANLDWVLTQLPTSFKRFVREGGPITRDAASDAYSGLYDPFKDRIFFPDNINPGGRTVEAVKQSERYMRSVMVHEMAHAWQIRQTSRINPGMGGVLKGLRGIVSREHDLVSDWSALSGWTIQSKWSLPDWLGKPHLPNSSNASYQLADLELNLLGRNKTFNLTNLKLDPTKDQTMISDYAKTDPYEDFAESVAAYVVDSAELKRRAPEKYAYIKGQVMAGREYANQYGVYP